MFRCNSLICTVAICDKLHCCQSWENASSWYVFKSEPWKWYQYCPVSVIVILVPDFCAGKFARGPPARKITASKVGSSQSKPPLSKSSKSTSWRKLYSTAKYAFVHFYGCFRGPFFMPLCAFYNHLSAIYVLYTHADITVLNIDDAYALVGDSKL